MYAENDSALRLAWDALLIVVDVVDGGDDDDVEEEKRSGCALA